MDSVGGERERAQPEAINDKMGNFQWTGIILCRLEGWIAIEITHRRLEISESRYVPPQISLKLQHRSFPEAARNPHTTVIGR